MPRGDDFRFRLICKRCNEYFLAIGANKQKCCFCQSHKYNPISCKECGAADKEEFCNTDCKLSYMDRVVKHPDLKTILLNDKDVYLDLKIASLEKIKELIASGLNPIEAKKQVLG